MEKKNYIATIQELLKDRNEEFENADPKRIRLIRHKDARKVKIIGGKEYLNSLYDIYLNDREAFIRYQSEQLSKSFANVDYIVSFIGEESCTSRFVGVYKVGDIIGECGKTDKGETIYLFEMHEIDGFELLKERVIIDWNNPISWLQKYQNMMPVIRIDRGLMDDDIPVFTRFEDVMLSYGQLYRIFHSPHNQEWKAKLESCNCIYLILDKSNGRHYIGSTYNKQGIWGRWAQYAETGHGGDVSLSKLLETDSEYAKKNFQWCILETLPLRIPDEQAIDRESLYKRKFGTREFGYNNN
jgi:hypothetical protein